MTVVARIEYAHPMKTLRHRFVVPCLIVAAISLLAPSGARAGESITPIEQLYKDWRTLKHNENAYGLRCKADDKYICRAEFKSRQALHTVYFRAHSDSPAQDVSEAHCRRQTPDSFHHACNAVREVSCIQECQVPREYHCWARWGDPEDPEWEVFWYIDREFFNYERRTSLALAQCEVVAPDEIRGKCRLMRPYPNVACSPIFEE